VTEMTGYLALIHKDKGTSYGVSFPDLPGCISAGDTLEEAIENASEALAGHLTLMRADRDPIPTARTIEELRQDQQFVDDATDAVVAFISPREGQATTIHPRPSSVISEVSYEPQSGQLILTFVTGRIYIYDDVPLEAFNSLVNARSKGAFFNSEIRDHYPSREVPTKILVSAE
jgi:predicted RNase H-like HicB family nuclease